MCPGRASNPVVKEVRGTPSSFRWGALGGRYPRCMHASRFAGAMTIASDDCLTTPRTDTLNELGMRRRTRLSRNRLTMGLWNTVLPNYEGADQVFRASFREDLVGFVSSPSKRFTERLQQRIESSVSSFWSQFVDWVCAWSWRRSLNEPLAEGHSF